MNHFISMKQLSSETIIQLLDSATNLQESNFTISKQLFAANLFFETSTRTKMSFTVAEKKLGMEVLDFHAEASSMNKGESLYDTVKTFEAIGANVAIIRHEADNWMTELASNIAVPIINAGSGQAEHPTQCMLDLLTIYQEFGCIKGIKVVIVGDIKHSRVAKSNAIALEKLGAIVYLCAAPGYEDETLQYPYITIDEAVEICDVLMLLRIQHERHTNKHDTAGYLEAFGLTKQREKQMKDHAIILHPAPVNRGVEIDKDIVEYDRSRIFKQMANGVYMRMAILIHVLTEWGIIDDTIITER
ncbi:aspartate carbamoyltransferase catalytic subunit [Ornithinibacillus contaminans]|uniref:aspartate carbamoyltransferase catalytic subunit n=1 Tax=Ornithinibacillus contaminans TaxID=694055 RepID=UPI00064DC038|nr:aspartate carbamoyltransferase catalytic subunit [Ornithinibacillus contaminans]